MDCIVYVVWLSFLPVDLLAHRFDVLKADLKSDMARINCIYYIYSAITLKCHAWGSIAMDHVLSESYNKSKILQRNYRKMTMKWSFSYNSFVKFHGKKSWEPQHVQFISKSML